MLSLRRLFFIVLMTILPVLVLSQPSQNWPGRTVRLITPGPPGGSPDIVARLFAEKLSMRWKASVIVENRPGADGMIAIQAVLGATDGHTLLATHFRGRHRDAGNPESAIQHRKPASAFYRRNRLPGGCGSRSILDPLACRSHRCRQGKTRCPQLVRLFRCACDGLRRVRAQKPAGHGIRTLQRRARSCSRSKREPHSGFLGPLGHGSPPYEGRKTAIDRDHQPRSCAHCAGRAYCIGRRPPGIGYPGLSRLLCAEVDARPGPEADFRGHSNRSK